MAVADWLSQLSKKPWGWTLASSLPPVISDPGWEMRELWTPMASTWRVKLIWELLIWGVNEKLFPIRDHSNDSLSQKLLAPYLKPGLAQHEWPPCLLHRLPPPPACGFSFISCLWTHLTRQAPSWQSLQHGQRLWLGPSRVLQAKKLKSANPESVCLRLCGGPGRKGDLVRV